MFTGIIEAVGKLVSARRSAGGAVLGVEAPFARELRRGESVAVNGVCLTVTSSGPRTFSADAVPRTLETTTLGGLRAGARVNLERAVPAGARMGGHIVAGHVEGVATVVEVRAAGAAREVVLELPAELWRNAPPRASIALDGTSLTVAAASPPRVTVALIPETLRATVAAHWRPGSLVNVETDLLLRGTPAANGAAEAGRTPGITLARLRELGYVKEKE